MFFLFILKKPHLVLVVQALGVFVAFAAGSSNERKRKALVGMNRNVVHVFEHGQHLYDVPGSQVSLEILKFLVSRLVDYI